MANYNVPVLDVGHKIQTGDLGSGTPSSSNYLRGDQTWGIPEGGGIVYTFENKDVQVTYIYYGWSKTGGWRLKRKTIATEVWGTAEGDGDYATAWADRENKTYI